MEEMSYKTFAGVLDAHRERIESSLPSVFTSVQFIEAAKDYCVDEYSSALRLTSYRGLHTWIARWYLNARYKQVGERRIISKMGNNSKNKYWRKK